VPQFAWRLLSLLPFQISGHCLQMAQRPEDVPAEAWVAVLAAINVFCAVNCVGVCLITARWVSWAGLVWIECWDRKDGSGVGGKAFHGIPCFICWCQHANEAAPGSAQLMSSGGQVQGCEGKGQPNAHCCRHRLTQLACLLVCRYMDERRERGEERARLLASRQATLHRFTAEVLDRLRELGIEDEAGTGRWVWVCWGSEKGEQEGARAGHSGWGGHM
jgi:hypothetical protein